MLSPEEVRRLITIQLEGDVNSDGFDGFFLLSGDDTSETLAALEAIGAHKTAAILRRARAKFPNATLPDDMEGRRALLLDVVNPDGTAFETEDADFYRYEDDLEGMVSSYESRWTQTT